MKKEEQWKILHRTKEKKIQGDILASQFLRNYTNIPLFSGITPEDIEDVFSKYRAFLGVEYESDTIKKVYIRKQDGTIHTGFCISGGKYQSIYK